jgi:predicted SnoaL-like aldol condensation-catalyzing enzyme
MRVSRHFFVAVLTGLLGALVAFSNTQAGTPTPQEQANMKLVEDFYAALEADLLNGGKKVRSNAEKYLSRDYIQHMEAAQSYGQGREAYIRMYEEMAAARAPASSAPPRPPTLIALMAQGDLVFRLNSRPGTEANQNPIYIFNVFRVKDGRLAEHWDGFSRPLDTEKVSGAAGASSAGK